MIPRTKQRSLPRGFLRSIGAGFVAAFGRLSAKLEPEAPEPFHHAPSQSQGLRFGGQEFVHHADLDHRETALYSLSGDQKVVLLALALTLAFGLLVNWHATLLVLFGVLTFLYAADLVFGFFLIYRSFTKNPEVKVSATEMEALRDGDLPTYTIFCPLYKEWQVVPQFVEAMERLDYPKEKLQVMFLLEEDDRETVQKISERDLPPHFEVVVVPHSKPKTKPKAMNWGLKFATGELIAIYDAEDKPEPDQLKKAVAAFLRLPQNTLCVQGKLNFYNPRQNLLTKLFTAEYSLWFDLVLPGLQSLGAPIPLGGTSNHFRADYLRSLGGWDAFNVTEDCDLGMRLAKAGYRTAMVDSTTYEEANSNLLNWYRQRSRWIKGYIQTYLVHMRRPQAFLKNGERRHLFSFQIVVGGKIMSMFINPLMWAVTAAYFAFRAQVGPFIETFFPAPVLYTGVFCFVFGNFLYLYYYLIGLSKRGHDGLVKYALLVPLYWLGMSLAAWKAVYEIFVKPHYWQKTVHGLHLAPSERPALEPAAVPLPPAVTVREVAPPLWVRLADRLRALVPAGLGELSGGSVLVAAMMLANFLNFVFNAYLGRRLSLEQFGALTFLNTLLLLLSVFVSAWTTTVNREVAYQSGHEHGLSPVVPFVRAAEKKGAYVALLASASWLAAAPLVASFFKVDGSWVLLAFAAVIGCGFLSATGRGFLSGSLNFHLAGGVIFAEALVKLVSAVGFVELGRPDWVALSLPVSLAAVLLLTAAFSRRVLSRVRPAPAEAAPFPKRLYLASILAGLASTAFLSLDVLLAKHFLSAAAAGQYSLLALVGKMIFFFGSLVTVFTVPLVSRAVGEGRDPAPLFYRILLGVTGLVFSAWLGLKLLGHWVLPLMFGPKVVAVLPYLEGYTAAVALFSVASAFVGYHLARKRYAFSYLALAVAGSLGAGLWANHGGLSSFVRVLFSVSSGYLLLAALLHVAVESRLFFARNLRDFFDVFFSDVAGEVVAPAGGRRILAFNWRDTKHAFAGGAEVYIHEMARRWVKDGNHVTLFCGNDGKSRRCEVVDGVHVVRRGGFYMVYLWAALYYFFQFRGKYDVVVDCHNGIPFFTPLFTREPVYCLMHHVHQEVFRRYLPRPLAAFAAFLENTAMPLIYRKTKFITISDSSKKEMEGLGLGLSGIEMVHPGVDLGALRPGLKHPKPLVLYLGRLKAYKSVDVLLKAFRRVLEQVPAAELAVVGDGEERPRLERLAKELELEDRVVFTGKVDEAEKVSWLQRAWVLVNPSMMEGWGITTIEANACGVPVVAADVPGLRDSVQNPHTGYLVPHGNDEVLAARIARILQLAPVRQMLGKNALRWAQRFGWDRAAEQFLRIILPKVPAEPEAVYIKGFSYEE